MSHFLKWLLKESARAIALPLFVFGALAVALAFTEPTSAPTGGTVYAPVNTGGTAQTKSGNFTSSGTVTGNVVNGTTQMCLGGSCISSWPSGGGGDGYWAANGSSIYNTNGGNVGIGNTGPSALTHIGPAPTAFTAPATPPQLLIVRAGFPNIVFWDNNQGANLKGWRIGPSSLVAQDFTFDALNDAGTLKGTRLYIDGSGNVGIGTTAPQTPLQINASAGPDLSLRDASQGVDGKIWSIINGGGNLQFRAINDAYTAVQATALVLTRSGNVGIGMTPGVQLDLSTDSARKLTTTTWSTGSDIRIKTNVQSISDALDIISRVRPVKFHYTPEFLAAHPSVKDTDYYNFIAQEYQQVFPNSVSTSTDGLLYLNSSNMIPYAIAGVKEAVLAFEAASSTDNLETGDIVGPDATTTGNVKKSHSGDTAVLGVVSSPRLSVAASGRMPVKVSTEGGPIAVGDQIAVSSFAGIGMKATTSGMTLGIALEPFDGWKTENGVTSRATTSKILVFVNLGYQNLDRTALALAHYSQYASSTASSTIPTFALRSDGLLRDGEFLNLQGADLVNIRSLVSANGSWEIGEDGTIRAVKIITNEIVADNIKARLVEAEQVKAKEIEASGFRVFRSANADETTIGEGRILRGNTETTIYSSRVASTSKIFVSFTSDLGARSWFIAQKSDGSGSTTPGFFMVRISAPLPDDAAFDWWVVETAGTVAPVVSSPPATNTLSSTSSAALQTSTVTNAVSHPSAGTTTATTATAAATATSSGVTINGVSVSSATTTLSDASALSVTATSSNVSTSSALNIISATTTAGAASSATTASTTLTNITASSSAASTTRP